MTWVLDTEYIEPTTLTGLIRKALSELQVNRFILSQWLPNVVIDDMTFEYSRGGGGLSEATPYRSWDAETPIGRREGISKVMGSLPPIGEKIPLNEYDQLRIRKLSPTDEMQKFIARDAFKIAENIGARLELARGEALVNGAISIDENGVVQNVDFGRSAGHSVTAAVLWSDYANAKPIDDLEAWYQTYVDTNGVAPGRILMPRAVLANLRQCAQIKGQVFPLANNAPVVNGEQVNTVLDSMNLPPIVLYDAQLKVDGAAARVIPSDKIVLLPSPGATSASQPSDLGATMLGRTAESLDPDYQSIGEQPGIVAATFKTKDPVRFWTHAAAVGLPILREPNLTLTAEVL